MTLCVAHRGEPRGHRENTLPAIRAGVAAGADLVEVDVQVTADGVPVLLHDATLHRLWNIPRAVASMPLGELRATVPGVPTLDEALSLARELGTSLVLDVTSVDLALAAEEVVRRLGVAESVVYCGDPEGLAAIRARDADVRIALTWKTGTLPDDAMWHRVRPQFFNPEWVHLSPEVVAAVHDRGAGVCTWTVDDPADMRRLIAMGVDAIISNEIAMLVQVARSDRG